MSDADRPAADEALQIWEESPVILGENPEEFQALRRKLLDVMHPQDLLEEMWVADLAGQVWDVTRCKKMTAALVRTSGRDAVVKMLSTLFTNGVVGLFNGVQALADGYARKEPGAIAKIEEHFTKAGYDWGQIAAEAFATRMSEHQKLNQLLAKAEARRNQTLKAFERHRAGLGPQLRAVAEQFEAESVRAANDQSPAPKLAA